MKYIAHIVVVAFAVMVTWNVKAQWFPDVRDVGTADTVYVDKPFETIVREQVEVPVRVTEYVDRVDTVRSVEVIRDTIYIETDSGRDLFYNTAFLTQYPTAPKFLQLDATDKYIEFTGVASNDGQTRSVRWEHKDEWTLTLSDDHWVSFSGTDSKINRGFYQEFGLGYMITDDKYVYGSYTGGYHYGRLGLHTTFYATKTPIITVGLQWK